MLCKSVRTAPEYSDPLRLGKITAIMRNKPSNNHRKTHTASTSTIHDADDIAYGKDCTARKCAVLSKTETQNID